VITGINHVTLSVKDLNESFDFYSVVLGFRPVARWPEGAYLEAGDTWLALVAESVTRENILPEYTHIAFSVSGKDFEKLSEKIISCGAEIWQKNESEGQSLYFIDPNGHKLEIHASDLAARMRWARENPWEGLEIFSYESDA